MSGPSAIYSELVIRHNRDPQGFGALPSATHRGVAVNRSCGDEVQAALAIENHRIVAAGFEGESCAICTAAASILCGLLVGRDPQAAARTLTAAQDLIESGDTDPTVELGELRLFAELQSVPARKRCAMLPVSAFINALESPE